MLVTFSKISGIPCRVVKFLRNSRIVKCRPSVVGGLVDRRTDGHKTFFLIFLGEKCLLNVLRWTQQQVKQCARIEEHLNVRSSFIFGLIWIINYIFFFCYKRVFCWQTTTCNQTLVTFTSLFNKSLINKISQSVLVENRC